MFKFLLPGCFLFFLTQTSLEATVNQNNDVQLWVKNSISKSINNIMGFRLSSEVRFGDDVNQPYFAYVQATPLLKCTPDIQITPGYRQIWRLVENRWRREYEPLIAFIFSRKANNWEVQHRSRFSNVFTENGDSILHYRSRLSVTTPWKVADRFNPFFSDEAFFNTRGGFFENRLIFGSSLSLMKQFQNQFYYMLRTIKVGEHWNNVHVIGLNYLIEF